MSSENLRHIGIIYYYDQRYQSDDNFQISYLLAFSHNFWKNMDVQGQTILSQNNVHGKVESASSLRKCAWHESRHNFLGKNKL